jgi:hypothetical protein
MNPMLALSNAIGKVVVKASTESLISKDIIESTPMSALTLA